MKTPEFPEGEYAAAKAAVAESDPKPVVSHTADDPVYVLPAGAEKLILRIGGFGQGEGRFTFLTSHEARIVAYTLLHHAEALSYEDARLAAQSEKWNG